MAVFVSGVFFKLKGFAKISQSSPVYPAVSKKGKISFSAEPAVDVYPSVKKIGRFYGTVRNGTKSYKISALSQELSIEGFIELWEMDLSRLGLGILRFTTDYKKTDSPLMWGGNAYMPYPIDAEGFDVTSQGANARPSLSVSAAVPEMTSLIISGKGLRGVSVRRIKTFARFLDDGTEPSTTDHYPVDRYVVNKVSQWKSGVFAKIELISPFDLETARLPKQQVLKNYCNKKYRVYDGTTGRFLYAKSRPCPYAGEKCYTAKNLFTAVQAEDVCAKTLEACALRFGKNNVLPFGGFPGIIGSR